MYVAKNCKEQKVHLKIKTNMDGRGRFNLMFYRMHQAWRRNICKTGKFRLRGFVRFVSLAL